MLEQPVSSWLMVGRPKCCQSSKDKTRKHWEGGRRTRICTNGQDEMTTFNIFLTTHQGLEDGENFTEKTEPEDDQDEEKEQSLSDFLPVRRQVARVHENMEHHQTVDCFVYLVLVEPSADSYWQQPNI